MQFQNNDKSDQIQHITIVGGGTAGWMCAAALSRLIPNAGVSITLIESDEIGTIGVGEATIPSIRQFNRLLEIDENEFMKRTQAAIKLGIEFNDWNQLGQKYFHPFGTFGFDAQAIKFHQLWLRLSREAKTATNVGDLWSYNLCTQAALKGRFARFSADANSVFSTLKYAYHLDAGLYAKYLREYAEKLGVKRIEGKIISVHQREDDGFLESVKLEDGRGISGDLFIDCSGFRGLLIEQSLKAGYENWQHYLPCDRAIAVPSKSVADPVPYTRATADLAGWRWEIPLQHRVGNGHVYCSKFMDDETASQRLMSGIAGEALAEPRFIKFTTGRRKKCWDKNCVAIGLSGGFIEPLESTSIYLIQSGISKLLALFPDMSFSQNEIDEYNRSMSSEYETIRDFILLHYKATNRSDTPFWRHCGAMEIPDSLQRKINLFKSYGRVVRAEVDIFTDDSWLAVLMGQGVEPRAYDPLTNSLHLDDSFQYVMHIKNTIAKATEKISDHSEFLRSLYTI